MTPPPGSVATPDPDAPPEAPPAARRPQPLAPVRGLPLRTRVLAAALASTFLVVAGAEAFRLWSVRAERLDLLTLKASRTAEFQATAMARPMFDYDQQVVTVLAKAMQADPEILGARVADANGLVVVEFGTVPTDDTGIVAARDLTYDNKGEDTKVGEITIAFSHEVVDHDVRRHLGLGVAGLLAIFAVLSLAIVTSFRRITSPLSGMTKTMLRLAEGHKDIVVAGLDRADEIGDMARAVEVFRRHAIEIERLEANKAAEAALRESEERLRVIVDSMPVPVIMTRRSDNTILFTNQQMRDEFFGAHFDPVGTRSRGFYVDFRDRDRMLADLARHGAVQNFEAQLRRPDGSTYWALISVTPTVFRGEQAFLAGVNDISARRRAEENLRKLSQAMEASPAMVVITDAAGQIEYVNKKFVTTLGYPKAETLGRSPRLLHGTPDSQAACDQMWQTLTANAEWRGEFEIQRADGPPLWVAASASPIPNRRGAVTSYVLVYNDITLLKSAEAEMARARDIATQANRMKSEFMANMSHEIRTPLNAVIGLTHLALKTSLTEQQADYLGGITASAEALLGILNDILDFSKIEADKLDMEAIGFSLDRVLHSLFTVLGHKARDAGLELLASVAADTPSGLVGDPLRLGQILINLVSNAIKFTKAGEVVLRVRHDPRPDGRVTLTFTVQDTGIGLRPDQITRLFRPFSQADSEITRRFGGTGLGLSICKRLVELMDGTIGVDSCFGEGSTFTFTAVFALDAAAAATPRRLDAVAGAAVLVVDDNAAAAAVTAQLLADAALAPATAATAAAAAALLDSAPPRLVLLDADMAGAGAVQARLAALPTPPALILLTTDSGDRHRRAAAALGGAVVHKPTTPAVLFGAVATALGQAGAVPDLDLGGLGADGRAKPDLAGIRVLLVEDNEINRRIGRELLTGEGCHVTEATNGAESVALLCERCGPAPFDVVLMDVQMPVMDGLTATRLIRADPRYAQLPIIAMTAQAMACERQECLDSGMDDHVTKPVVPLMLYATVAHRVAGRAGPAPVAAPAAAQTAPPARTGIDLAWGLAQLGGDRDFYRELLTLFTTQHGDADAVLRGCLDRGDTAAAGREMHSIKSAAASLGLHDLHSLARQLERAFRDGDDDVATPVAAFAAALGESLAAIGRYA